MLNDLQVFFDTEDFSKTSGISKYFALLLSNKNAFNEIVADNCPLPDDSFPEINKVFNTDNDFNKIPRKVVVAIVRRINIERRIKKYVIYDKKIVSTFLKLSLIYFGSNKNISNLEKTLWKVQKELFSFISLKKYDFPVDSEDIYLAKIENTTEEINDLFLSFNDLDLNSIIVFCFIFIYTKQTKELENEVEVFGLKESDDKEKEIEYHIDTLFIKLLKNNLNKLINLNKEIDTESEKENIME